MFIQQRVRGEVVLKYYRECIFPSARPLCFKRYSVHKVIVVTRVPNIFKASQTPTRFINYYFVYYFILLDSSRDVPIRI